MDNMHSPDKPRVNQGSREWYVFPVSYKASTIDSFLKELILILYISKLIGKIKYNMHNP
jgi:hypothetical protein